MPIRRRGPWWHYRFTIAGQEYAGSTRLRATEENRRAAERLEKHQIQLVRTGNRIERTRDFASAAGEFISWCTDVQYRQKRNTSARIKVSFASLVEFFGEMPVTELDAGHIERYKAHRIQVNRVRDVTLRHDLHALSLFFKYAEKMRWRDGNPVKQVSIPSDRDSIRIHVVTDAEETKYFQAAYSVLDSAKRRNLFDVAKVILNQGCRPEEIMSAPKSALDVRAATLAILGGKSRAACRTLHLTSESLQILRERLNTPGPWLFPSDRYPGNHITKLQNAHDKVCRSAGVSF